MSSLSFFEPTSVMTAGGAAVVIQLIANTGAQFGIAARWSAIVMSLALAALNANYAIPWYLAGLMILINTCFLFCTALGLSKSFQAVGQSGSTGFGSGSRSQWSGFFRDWF